MKKTKYLLNILIVLNLLVCIYYLLAESKAYEYSNNNYTLFYKEDKEELEDNIKKYLQEIDNILITNTNFTQADTLIENYDYMVNFAMDYIMNNKEYYQNEIQVFGDFIYEDSDKQLKITNEFIKIDTIYKITDKYFGIRDFKITNPNIKIIDDKISIINNSGDSFSDIIKKVEIKESDNYITAYASNYIYTFWKKNNVLKLYNIEVSS